SSLGLHLTRVSLRARPAAVPTGRARLMTMGVRHAETGDRIALEVELDQHDRLVADHPAIVPGLDGDDLRRAVLDDAAVGVLDVDLAAREEADVRVHAEVGADDRLHVDRPAKAGRIDHALDARPPGSA